MEVESPDVFRVGEVVLLGEQEAKMVIDEGSLVFRFPLDRDYPEGTIVRPLAESEFLQAEGDRLCVYRRAPDDEIHFVCYVDLLERATPERGGEVDDTGGSGVVVPPLSSAHERSQPLRARVMDLPAFGQGTSGNAHREDAGEAGQGPRGSGEQGDARREQPATLH